MTSQSTDRVLFMTWKARVVLRQAVIVMVCAAAMLGAGIHPAAARVFVGIGIPFYGPGFYPPPYYYPPPVYYPPPPVYYTPPQTYAPPPAAPPPGVSEQARGQACYAASYVCPMDRPAATGGTCYCLGNGGQKVWGRTN